MKIGFQNLTVLMSAAFESVNTIFLIKISDALVLTGIF